MFTFSCRQLHKKRQNAREGSAPSQEVIHLAKETMQAVSQAEQAARQTVEQAREASQKLVEDAQEQGRQLIAKAVKEAGKKAEVLGIVAKADGEKAAARADQETDRFQAQLREAAEQRRPQVLAEIRKIVLGQS